MIKRFMIVILCGLVVAILVTTAWFTKVDAKKKYYTSGRAPKSNALWSYNKKNKTLTIKPNKNNSKRKAHYDSFEYRSKHASKVVYKEGMTRIGEFGYCCRYQGFKSVVIPGSVKTITADSFYENYRLRKVVLKNGIESIGVNSFKSTYLNHVTLPATIKSICEDAFADATTSDIYLNYGIQFVGKGAFRERCCLIPDLPDSISYIGPQAFRSNAKLESVILPKNLSEVSEELFCDCSNLSECTLSESITAIRSRSFAYTSISEMIIPRNVEYLGTDVEIPYKNQTYPEYAHKVVNHWGYEYDCIWDEFGIFSGCNNLKKLRFNTKKLKKVYPRALEGIGDNVVIEVPVGYKDKYQQLFAEGGLNPNVSIVEVEVNDTDVDSVRLNRTEFKAKAGTERKMELLYADDPDNVVWESSDSEVITIDSSGNASANGVGNATIKATYKGMEFTCQATVIESDANDDVNELKKLIKKQKEYGAKDVSTNIYSNQYKWENGRLKEINWDFTDANGEIDLNSFTYLESFTACGDYVSIWKLEGDDLVHLKSLDINGWDLVDINLHIENAKDVCVKRWDTNREYDGD
jgi:hypothetical protein